MKPNNSPEKLICESCHQEFPCGVNVGKCWCFEVNLDEKTLAKLREDFKRCLCQECLEMINQPQINANDSAQ